MRIVSISVTGLFDVFDHFIELNTEDRITIIHAPNGFGKTTLLRMTHSLFNSGYSYLRSVPFHEFRVYFDNNSSLKVTKLLERQGDISTPELVFQHMREGSEDKPFSPRVQKRVKDLSFPLSLLDSWIPGLERVGSLRWRYIPTNEMLTLEDVLERFGDALPVNPARDYREPKWWRNIKDSVNIHFIETQRLLSRPSIKMITRYERHASMQSTLAVIDYSEELTKTIQSKLAEYATLSQSLDQTFPARLVQQPPSAELSVNEIQDNMKELEEKRSRLMAAGLLDENKDIDPQIPDQQIDRARSVLSVYVKDVGQKLSIFNELADKIELFKTIINKRFLYKQMTINKDSGFIFTASNSNPLSPKDLSSGEQHELVLLYQLLFKTKPDSLILIDEPEISLHVVWQQQFLSDLQEITKLADFDVLIATHSPQIIHNRWDLTVELKGPMHEAVPNGG